MPSTFGLWGDSLDHLVHLLVAFVLALPIAWNRARVEHSAGIHTFPLVAMASCGLVQTAISVIGASIPNNANILQGVVTGIGFIGAGAIIRQGDFTTGYATAASVWRVGVTGRVRSGLWLLRYRDDTGDSSAREPASRMLTADRMH